MGPVLVHCQMAEMEEGSEQEETIMVPVSEIHLENRSEVKEEGPGASALLRSGAPGMEVYKVLLVQQQEFHEQLDELQRLLAVQRECTGQTGLEDAMTATILAGNSGWQKPMEELPSVATTSLEQAFSLKDSVTKAEARDLGNVFGISAGQVKDFFVAQRGHVRTWLRSMQSGPSKGSLKQGPQRTEEARQGGARGKEAPKGKREARTSTDVQLGEGKTKAGARNALIAAPTSQAVPVQSVTRQAADGCNKTTLGRSNGDSLRAETEARHNVPSFVECVDAGNAVDPAKGTLLVVKKLELQEVKKDGVASNEITTETGVGTSAHASVTGTVEKALAESKAAVPPLDLALPLDPFQQNVKPRGLAIDLNMPPDETADALTESRQRDRAAPDPPSNGTTALYSTRSAVAALCLGALEKRAVGPRRVHPEAVDVRGQVSQLVAREGGPVGEDRAARLVRVMRRESSVAGRMQILDTLAKQRKRLVHSRLLEGGGVAVLHRWLVDAVNDEQTSLLRTLLQVLSVLPLRVAGAPHVASLVKTLFQMRHYFVADVASLAQQLVVQWRQGRVTGEGRRQGQTQEAGSDSRTPHRTPNGATLHPKASPLKVKRREIPSLPPSRVSSMAASLWPVAAPSAPPSPTPIASAPPPPPPPPPLRSSPALPGSFDAPPKRAGSPLGAALRKQARLHEGPESAVGRRQGQGGKAGRFAQLLQRGRRRDSGEAEVAALLQGAMAVGGGDEGEKPLSSDDIRKAKAREQLIRQMQRKNGSSGRGGGTEAAGSDVGGRAGERKGSRGRMPREEGGAEGGQTVPRLERPGLEARAARKQEGEAVPGPQTPHRNGDTLASAMGDQVSSGSLDGVANPSPTAHSATVTPSPAVPPPIDVAAMRALAQVLQMDHVSTRLPPPAPAPAPTFATSPAPETALRQTPPHSIRGRPTNPLLAQLVAEVERQKARERERVARGGPQAAATAEARQSGVLLQQLEAQVAALVAHEARQGAQQQGNGEGWARAVALMEDRAIVWRTPPAVSLDPAWNVPAGCDSAEAVRLAARDAATMPDLYPVPALIPAEPRPPKVTEPEADDRRTPEITMVDLKQQAATAAASADEDAEYQAAVAEAYGMEHKQTIRSPAVMDGGADWQRGRPSSAAPPFSFPALTTAPTSAGLHQAGGGASDRWIHAPGARPRGGPPGRFADHNFFHALTDYGFPPRFSNPNGDLSWPRGPPSPQHQRVPLTRPQRDPMVGRNRGPPQQYGARPPRGGWSGW